jgi:hypothetical protein
VIRFDVQERQGQLKIQSPQLMARVAEMDDGMLGHDSEHISRWEDLMEMKILDQIEGGKNLLSVMGLLEENEEIAVFREEHSVRSKEMTGHIAATRMNKSTGMKLEHCVKRKKKRNRWGPVLVDRQRRKIHDSITYDAEGYAAKAEKEFGLP